MSGLFNPLAQNAVAITGGTIDGTVFGGSNPAPVNATTLTTTGTASFQSTGYFSASVTYFNAATAGLRIGSLTVAGTPYLDFYSSGVTSGYDVRLIASGGSATAGQGLLQVYGSLTVNGALKTTTSISPSTDNAVPLGTSALRFSQLYAGTSTINTSDAREKTTITALTDAELAAAKDLAAAIGSYKFLSAVALKGDGARTHIGLTVQNAITILTAHGLDPMAYGFICHDTWDAVPGTPAIAATPDVPAVYAPVLDDSGQPTGAQVLVTPEIFGTPAIPAVPDTPAGDRYGFRIEELLLFLARGFDARLTALEAA